MIAEEVARLRREYEAAGLIEAEMAADPFSEFDRWFTGALKSGIEQPNAFVLATSSRDGSPSARAVLMKDFDQNGLAFYTGLDSAKSEDLKVNPKAAATFVWVELHRQVRLVGSVSPVDDPTADRYFATRPRGAQIAAHASHQGEVVEDREALDRRFAEFDSQFTDHVPRPHHWGGWRLQPESVEFWQGQPNRFHDRVRYVPDGDGWRKERLAP